MLESPARRAVRLGRGVPDGGVESEAVEVPGRRAGARGAVRGREGVALAVLAFQTAASMERTPFVYIEQMCARII